MNKAASFESFHHAIPAHNDVRQRNELHKKVFSAKPANSDKSSRPQNLVLLEWFVALLSTLDYQVLTRRKGLAVLYYTYGHHTLIKELLVYRKNWTIHFERDRYHKERISVPVLYLWPSDIN